MSPHFHPQFDSRHRNTFTLQFGPQGIITYLLLREMIRLQGFTFERKGIGEFLLIKGFLFYFPRILDENGGFRNRNGSREDEIKRIFPLSPFSILQYAYSLPFTSIFQPFLVNRRALQATKANL